MKNKKLEWVIVTWNDILEAMKVPTPIRNKKKYRRKTKHKGKQYE